MINIGIGIPFGQRSAGIDPQAKIAFDSLQSAGFTTPQGIVGINAAFKTIKTIYGTSDITTAISFFGDPSLAYQIGAGSGTTLGQAIRTLPNIIDPTRATDAVQTTAASQPLLLTHTTGQNYWFGSGVSGNFVSTPNSAANSNNGNKEIILNLDITNLSAQTELINKDDVGSNRGWRIFLTSTRFITVLASTDLSAYILNPPTSDVALPLNFKGFVKITFTFFSGSLNVLFFTSSDGITYTQLGTQRSKLGNNLINTNAELALGIVPLIGVSDKIKIFRATISNSIGGAPVVDFNPNQYNPSTSQTQWTSSTGEVWTINTGTAATGYKGVLVNRTIVQGDAIGAYMQENGSLGINVNSANSFYLASRKFTTASQFPFEYRLASGSNGIICRISNVYSNYREGQSYFATTFSNNTLLNLFNSVFQANNNRSARLNSATIQTDSTAGTISTQAINNIGIFGFGAGTGANYNGIINSLIITKVADNSTQQTDMYNYIRSINGNSF